MGSLWHVSSKTLVERIKAAFAAGEHYVKNVSHIFMVNSSSLFNVAWKLARNLISPRTASKITVSQIGASLPQELVDLLGPKAEADLRELLATKKRAPLALPPEGVRT